VVELVDKRKPHGGNMSEAPTGATLPGKTCYTTAQAVGISSRQVERVRAVLDEPEMREAVERGEKSIRQADIEIREQRRLARPTFKVARKGEGPRFNEGLYLKGGEARALWSGTRGV